MTPDHAVRGSEKQAMRAAEKRSSVCFRNSVDYLPAGCLGRLRRRQICPPNSNSGPSSQAETWHWALRNSLLSYTRHSSPSACRSLPCPSRTCRSREDSRMENQEHQIASTIDLRSRRFKRDFTLSRLEKEPIVLDELPPREGIHKILRI